MGTDHETEAKLLASAKSEFLEKGYAKASLRKICANAGMTTGALYFFFKDKPKEDNLTAMSYSRAATMQSLMQKVSAGCQRKCSLHASPEDAKWAEHKGTPVDQLMSRLNLLKY